MTKYTARANIIKLTSPHRSLTLVKLLLIRQFELWALEFLICIEECINEDVKEEEYCMAQNFDGGRFLTNQGWENFDK